MNAPRHFKRLFGCLPLLFAFAPLATEAVDTLFTATLDGSLTWNRDTGGAGGYAYLTATFVPTVTGSYTFLNTASTLTLSNDPFAYLFSGSFDPTINPATNPNKIASDDDSGGNFRFKLNNVPLTLGTTYILVPTVYLAGSLGSYDVTISGPATINFTVAGGASNPPPVVNSDIVGGGTFSSSNLGSSVSPAFDGGTLQVSSGSVNVSQSFTVSGQGGSIDSHGNASVFSGVISDLTTAGSLTITNTVGSGSVTFTGTNTYTGGTRISSGTLQVGAGGTTGSIVGNVSLDGTLAFNRSDTLTFGGSISGNGQLVQAGTGKTLLTGASSFTGTVIAQSGTLSVNGSIPNAASIQVNSGASLGGSGTVSNVTVQAGGKLAPGNSIATLNSVGNLSLLTGSTTVIEIDDTSADRFNTTGTANIAGTLQVVPFGNLTPFPVGTGHTIVGANLGVAGAFTSVTQPLTGILSGTRFDTVYMATAVQLYVTPTSYTDLSSSGVNLNTNQKSVGAALDAVRAASGTRLSGTAAEAVFNGLYPLNASQVATALNHLSGEIHTAIGPVAARSSELFLNAMLDPFEAQRETGRSSTTTTTLSVGSLSAGGKAVCAASPQNSPFELWGSTFAGEGHADGNASTGSARRSDNVVGGVAGVSMALGSQTVVGFGAGDSDVNASLAEGLGNLSANVFHSGFYGTSRLGDVRIGAALGYSLMGIETTRSMSWFGSSSFKGKYDVPVWSSRLRVAYEGFVVSGFTLAPYSLIQASQAHIPNFSESNASTGADSGISSKLRTATTAQTELGVKVTRSGKVAGLGVTGMLQTGWVHYLKEDTDLDASFAGLSGAQFTIRGARNDKNLARISTGFEVQLTSRAAFGSQVELSASSNTSAVSGLARIQYAF